MTLKKAIFGILILFFIVIGLGMWLAKNNPPPSFKTEGFSGGSSITKQARPFSGQISVITDDDPYVGSKDAPLKIVEFLDFQCPYCKQSFPIMRRFAAQHPDIVFYQIRDLPLTDIHEHALRMAEAAGCAQAQDKFWPLHDKMFLEQDAVSENQLWVWAQQSGLDMTAFTSCMQSQASLPEIQQDAQDAINVGARGTPTFVINGTVLSGVIPEKTLEELVASVSKP